MRVQAILLILFFILQCGCSATKIYIPPLEMEIRRELAISYYQKGKRDFEDDKYCGAIKSLKLACYLDRELKDANWLMKEAETSFHWQERDKFYKSLGEVAALVSIHPAYINEAKEKCRIDYEVGKVLMQFGIFDGAIEIFQEGLDRCKWFPYKFDENDYYQNLFKSCLEDCGQKAIIQSSKELDEEKE